MSESDLPAGLWTKPDRPVCLQRHLPSGGRAPEQSEILRKVDHSAIYLLIAGTYTPFCINAFTGFWRWGLLSIIWSLAFIGILVKVFTVNAPRWISAGVYVVMGWLCIAAIGEMLVVLPTFALTWLIAAA